MNDTKERLLVTGERLPAQLRSGVSRAQKHSASGLGQLRAGSPQPACRRRVPACYSVMTFLRIVISLYLFV